MSENVLSDNSPEMLAKRLTTILQNADIIGPNHRVGTSRGCTKANFIKKIENIAIIRGSDKEMVDFILSELESSSTYDILFKEE